MKTLILAAGLGLGLCSAAFAAETPEVSLTDIPSGAYVMDNTHTSLNWKVSHFGLSRYTARFTRFTVDLNFDAQSPEKSSLSVSIDPTSIRTDFPNPEKEDFDQTLAKGDKWFNADKFPAITYRATGITRTGKNTGTISGNMTMLGKTLPVSIDVTLNGAYAKHPMAGDPTIGFSGHGTLKRSDWGLSTFVPMVGDEVEFFIEAEFHKAP
jgi:polyisoprenoid-binding protein YceI